MNSWARAVRAAFSISASVASGRAKQGQAGHRGDKTSNRSPATAIEDPPHDERNEHPLGNPGRGDGKAESNGEGQEPTHANSELISAPAGFRWPLPTTHTI